MSLIQFIKQHSFFIAGIIGTFIIWLIPSQKSYHYAFTSSIFLNLFGIVLIFKSLHPEMYMKILRRVLTVFCFFIISILFLSFYLNGIDSIVSRDSRYQNILAWIIASLFITLKTNLKKTFSLFLLIEILFLTFTLKVFVPPQLSQKGFSYLEDSTIPIFTNINKKTYLEEELDTTIHSLNVEDICHSTHSQSFFIIETQQPDLSYPCLKEMTRWLIWKRRVTFEEIFKLLLQRDFSSLIQTRYLFATR